LGDTRSKATSPPARTETIDGAVVSIGAAVLLALLAIVGVAALIRWWDPIPPCPLMSGRHSALWVSQRQLACDGAFISTPEFFVWLGLLCAQGAFWALAVGPVLQMVRDLVRELRAIGALTSTTIAGIAVSGFAFMSLAAAIGFGWLLVRSSNAAVREAHEKYPVASPLGQQQLKIGILTGAAFSISALAIAGIWLAGIGFHRIAGERRADIQAVEHFLDLRTRLNRFLATVGIMVGLATLASGALRNAVLALNDPKKPTFNFDPQYVLMYGFLLSGLLGIAFAPSYLAMRNAGARLRDLAYPLPAPGDPTFTSMVKERGAFEDYLQTNVSASASFRAGVAIVTPLASSLLALLIPKVT
jgi:hypothetical protein